MNNQAERIHAAILRFKAERSPDGSRQVKPCQAEATVRQMVVVVNEQNLAALSLSSVDSPRTRAPRRGMTEATD